MDKNTKIVLTKKLDVSELSGEKVMIDFETGKYFLLKGVGNDIWTLIQEEITVGAIVEKLMQEYEVSQEECETSVVDFLTSLQKYGFLK